MNDQLYSLGWLPVNISAHGAPIDRLLYLLHAFMFVIFLGWGIYYVYCLVRFRERPGHEAKVPARHTRLPAYLELGILAVEICLLVFVSAPIWGRVKNDFPGEGALVVRVVAEQYAWNVQYPGRDGKFGRTSLDKIDGTNPLGLDRDDPAAKDDIVTVNELHVPVNRPAIVHLSSKDVIHSFSIPVMRVKQDVIPGMDIPIHFEAVRAGEFDIACAQLCGLGHYRMRGSFKVDSADEFKLWLLEQEKELGQ